MPDHPTHSTTSPPSVFIADDSEFLLYRMHGFLLSLSFDIATTTATRCSDTEAALAYMERKDPDRARQMRSCLDKAAALLEDTADLLDNGIHWATIEAFFCPPEDGFIDTPGAWAALGQLPNERDEQPPTLPENVTPEESSPVEVAPEKPIRRASAGALRSLGRSLRSELETEKRRFYATAREHGLPTDTNAAPAMRAALGELFGEALASRKQLTARQWSVAASSIVTEDLHWDAPKAKAQPRGAGMRP